MFLPEPLPETDDLTLKHLYNWLNRLRDYAQSITPKQGATTRVLRGPGGSIIEAPTPRASDTGIRSVWLWQLPPIEISHLKQDGTFIDSFQWYGCIAIGIIPGVPTFGDWAWGDSLFATDFATSAGKTITYSLDPFLPNDSNSTLVFYLVDFPVEFRGQILGETYSDQNMSAFAANQLESVNPFEGEFNPSDSPIWFDKTEDGAASDDYQQNVDPPYFPGATLYIAKPNNVNYWDRFTYEDDTYGTVELNVGWVDMNAAGRRWMPAGLVENHMRILLNIGPDPENPASSGGCILNNDGTAVISGEDSWEPPTDVEDAFSIPVYQDTNHPPS